MIALPLGTLAAWLAWPFSQYTLALVRALAHAPTTVPPNLFWIGWPAAPSFGPI